LRTTIETRMAAAFYKVANIARYDTSYHIVRPPSRVPTCLAIET
jgi:hypothetical protein